MANQWVAVEDVLKKMEAADLKILAESLVPALIAQVEHFIPAQYQAVADLGLKASQPYLQSCVDGLVSKLMPAEPGA